MARGRLAKYCRTLHCRAKSKGSRPICRDRQDYSLRNTPALLVWLPWAPISLSGFMSPWIMVSHLTSLLVIIDWCLVLPRRSLLRNDRGIMVDSHSQQIQGTSQQTRDTDPKWDQCWYMLCWVVRATVRVQEVPGLNPAAYKLCFIYQYTFSFIIQCANRDPQLQVGENHSQLFNLRPSICKSWC